MPTPPPPPKKKQAAPPPAKSFKVQQRKPVKRPPVVMLNAVEGWGKTSIAANAPDPLILMSGNETGYDTLLGHGLVPQVNAAVVESWDDTLGWVRSLAQDSQGIKTLALDAVGGFEHLARDHICNRDFGGDWGESGFAAYGRGFQIVEPEWKLLIQALEQLRDRQGVQVILLGHTKIESFKNPTGPDYNRYAADVHDRVWGLTSKFADAVLFGNFYHEIKTDRANQRKSAAERKGKVVGEAMRVVITEKRDGWEAKNRFDMPAEIWIQGDAAGMYDEIWQHINKEQ